MARLQISSRQPTKRVEDSLGRGLECKRFRLILPKLANAGSFTTTASSWTMESDRPRSEQSLNRKSGSLQGRGNGVKNVLGFFASGLVDDLWPLILDFLSEADLYHTLVAGCFLPSNDNLPELAAEMLALRLPLCQKKYYGMTDYPPSWTCSYYLCSTPHKQNFLLQLLSFRCVWCGKSTPFLSQLHCHRVCKTCFVKRNLYRVIEEAAAAKVWAMDSEVLSQTMPYVQVEDAQGLQLAEDNGQSASPGPRLYSVVQLEMLARQWRSTKRFRRISSRRRNAKRQPYAVLSKSSRIKLHSSGTQQGKDLRALTSLAEGPANVSIFDNEGLLTQDQVSCLQDCDHRHIDLSFIGFEAAWSAGILGGLVCFVAQHPQASRVLSGNHLPATCKSYRTISEAVQGSDAGTTILVAEGLYIEDVDLSKPLRLVGVGDVTISSHNSVTLNVTAPGCLVENITFQQHRNPFFGVACRGRSASLLMLECVVYGENKTCVAVYEGAELRMKKNLVRGPCAFAGVAVFDHGRAFIEENEIRECCTWAVQVDGTSEATIRRNYLHHCCAALGAEEYPILNEREDSNDNVVDCCNTIWNCGHVNTWYDQNSFLAIRPLVQHVVELTQAPLTDE